MQHQKRWTTEEIKILNETYDKLSKINIMSKIQGRTWGSITQKAEALGLRRKFADRKGLLWSDEEIQILKKYYFSNNKKKLKAMLPNRNWKSILDKARKLGLENHTLLAQVKNGFKKKVKFYIENL